jgi:CD109 antigen
MEYHEESGSAAAIEYLEEILENLEDPYTLAITTYALELAGSDSCDTAYQMLMQLAIEDENGLHWNSGDIMVNDDITPVYPIPHNQSVSIETTAYATLALVEHDDAFNASRAAKWLVSQRNAYGGYGSTQDTVMALQALTQYSSGTRADVDLTITIESSTSIIDKRITPQNFDILQLVEVPINDHIKITTKGMGEAVAQLVTRFNLPQVMSNGEILTIEVDYDTTQVEVNDLVDVAVKIEFNPPQQMEAGMVVVDVSVPTGFTPVMESIVDAAEGEKKIKRYETAGRKVIFYIDNMLPDDSLSFSFKVQATFPVKAKGVISTVYSYYQPDIRDETLGKKVTISYN